MEDVLAAAAHLEPPFAVRSSAVGEDSAGHSAAGQYETVTGVREPAALLAAVTRCLESAGSDRVQSYLGGSSAAMAVVIQHQVAAGRSGVAFSVDPVSGARGAVLVEAVFGYGEGLVGGLVTPDRFRVSDDGRVWARRSVKALAVDGAGRRRRLSDERRNMRTLRDDEALEVAGHVRRAEAGLGTPVDIEFCFEGPRLWLLQCRPITGLHRL
jgi:pyruvate,water dikinase